MADRPQQPVAATSRASLDVYQQITAIPLTDSQATDACVSDAPETDAGFVDLVIWGLLIASLAIGFWS